MTSSTDTPPETARCAWCSGKPFVDDGRLRRHFVGPSSPRVCPASGTIPWRAGPPDIETVRALAQLHDMQDPDDGSEPIPVAFFQVKWMAGAFQAIVGGCIVRDAEGVERVEWGYGFPAQENGKYVGGKLTPLPATSASPWHFRPLDITTGDPRRWEVPAATPAAPLSEAKAELETLRAELEQLRAESESRRALLPEAYEAVRQVARQETREEERAACVALAEKTWMEHPLTRDRHHEPGCICDAIGRGACAKCDRGEAILAALREVPSPDGLPGWRVIDCQGDIVALDPETLFVDLYEALGAGAEFKGMDIHVIAADRPLATSLVMLAGPLREKARGLFPLRGFARYPDGRGAP